MFEEDSPTDNRRPQPPGPHPAKPGKRRRKATVRPSGGSSDNPPVEDAGGSDSEQGGGVHADDLVGPEPGPQEFPDSKRNGYRQRGKGGTSEATAPTATRGRRSKSRAADVDKPLVVDQRLVTSSTARLAELKSLIRADLEGLQLAYRDAIARKIRLGEHLTEVRTSCKTERGTWTTFLQEMEIPERCAREAIVFYIERFRIDQLRHEGARLKVADVRLALAVPKRQPVPPDDSEDDVASPKPLALPAPTVDRRAAGIDDELEQAPARSSHEEGFFGSVVASEQEQPPGPPTAVDRPALAPTGSLGTIAHTGNHELVLAKFLTIYLKKAEEVILGLQAGLPRPMVERIRQQVDRTTAVFEKLQAALAALEETAL